MEFIKNSQCLKIRVAYDQDGGYIGFKEFFAESGLEEIGGNLYAYFPNAPRWTEEEINGMTEDESQEWQDVFGWDWTRYTLADVSWREWYAVAQEEDVIPYRYTATGHSQSAWAHLYLFGMPESEAEAIASAFESYACDVPYLYDIELIDCEDGRTIAEDSCGGIYDDTYDLDYLKYELSLATKCLGRIDEELKTLALEAVQAIDYTTIDN